ncbi:DUF6879 family protein [Streptomyces prunicolor]|uniref:DUF6879 family protein n=1 Tax=Streptomyces prunicolor TaxID=67348 RepID=UPI00341FE7E7
MLHFDDADEYLGAGLVEDPARIAEFIRIRDAAWPHAIRRRDFAAQWLRVCEHRLPAGP